jgi:tetratricopeptide (TPR) repeat protein
MTKSQIIAIAASVGAIILLYNFPKFVVDNAKLETAEQLMRGNDNDPSDNSLHGSGLTSDIQPIIYSLKSKISAGISNNSLTFADSLARLYLTKGYLDSAAFIADQIRDLDSEKGNVVASDIYFRAFNLSTDKKEALVYASTSREILNGILEENPDDFEIQTKIALTLVASENPMQGILMLREISEKDPNNWGANFNLGLLSIQSGQYEKALERFEKLTLIKSDDIQANFYLGVSLLELKKFEEAKNIFLKVKQLSSDPTVLSAVDGYLEEIQKTIN